MTITARILSDRPAVRRTFNSDSELYAYSATWRGVDIQSVSNHLGKYNMLYVGPLMLDSDTTIDSDWTAIDKVLNTPTIKWASPLNGYELATYIGGAVDNSETDPNGIRYAHYRVHNKTYSTIPRQHTFMGIRNIGLHDEYRFDSEQFIFAYDSEGLDHTHYKINLHSNVLYNNTDVENLLELIYGITNSSFNGVEMRGRGNGRNYTQQFWGADAIIAMRDDWSQNNLGIMGGVNGTLWVGGNAIPSHHASVGSNVYLGGRGKSVYFHPDAHYRFLDGANYYNAPWEGFIDSEYVIAYSANFIDSEYVDNAIAALPTEDTLSLVNNQDSEISSINRISNGSSLVSLISTDFVPQHYQFSDVANVTSVRTALGGLHISFSGDNNILPGDDRFYRITTPSWTGLWENHNPNSGNSVTEWLGDVADITITSGAIETGDHTYTNVTVELRDSEQTPQVGYHITVPTKTYHDSHTEAQVNDLKNDIKAATAAATDFADFQSRIANL